MILRIMLVSVLIGFGSCGVAQGQQAPATENAAAIAVGTMSHSKKAGMRGRAGELNLRGEYLLRGDGRSKLRGIKGGGKEGAAAALTVLFGPIGLIKHGKNVEIKQGTALTIYTDENYAIPTAK